MFWVVGVGVCCVCCGWWWLFECGCGLWGVLWLFGWGVCVGVLCCFRCVCCGFWGFCWGWCCFGVFWVGGACLGCCGFWCVCGGLGGAGFGVVVGVGGCVCCVGGIVVFLCGSGGLGCGGGCGVRGVPV
ncbi:hypothetical protein RA264_27595, partial [Pseudomonas syringae pv. tagetis]|uniref:hypothetical protein n=1 Tax=Pseudomonas syringae group genomosp. 7 TaxID=251699 RepID=UPI00376F7006